MLVLVLVEHMLAVVVDRTMGLRGMQVELGLRGMQVQGLDGMRDVLVLEHGTVVVEGMELEQRLASKRPTSFVGISVKNKI